MSQKTWLITGCSSGLGRELAVFAAEKGDQVVATVRKESQVESLNSKVPGRIDTIVMDVVNQDQVKAGITHTLSSYGRLDILVNNAGYGSIGPVEEISDEEVKRQFNVNVFGAVSLIRESLAHMRTQRSGHIINITSIAGLRGTMGLGIYNGSKFALEGIGEALAQEVRHLGIHVTNVEPGPFRTKWAGASATYVALKNADYEASAGELMKMLNEKDGNQPGDPQKAVAAMFALSRLESPPVHLPLGAFAYDAAYDKLAALKKELEQYEHLGRPTDFDT
jgi:NAD(P)-dependent dehydrogenase (short-subunit alcohol dehydrogenase family)